MASRREMGTLKVNVITDRRFGQPYIVGSFTRSDTVKSSRTFVYSSTQHSAAQTHRRQPIIGK